MVPTHSAVDTLVHDAINTGCPQTLLLRHDSGFRQCDGLVHCIAAHMEYPKCRVMELDVDILSGAVVRNATMKRFVSACQRVPSLGDLRIAANVTPTSFNAWMRELLSFVWNGSHQIHSFALTVESRTAYVRQVGFALHNICHDLCRGCGGSSSLRALTITVPCSSFGIVLQVASLLTNLRALHINLHDCNLSYLCLSVWQPHVHSILSHVQSLSLYMDNTCLTNNSAICLLQFCEKVGLHRSVQNLHLSLKHNDLTGGLWKQLGESLGAWPMLKQCDVYVDANICGAPSATSSIIRVYEAEPLHG